MLRTGLVIDPRYQNHLTGAGHPERPSRIAALLNLVEDYGREELQRIEPRAATVEELALVHSEAHIARVAATASRPASAFDADTPVSADSHETALLAAGGLLALLDAIIENVVMDWDVHHGNGTQHSFAADPGVLYLSTHQYPWYPGTGAANEVGTAEGEGFTVNLPLPPGCGDGDYLELFETVIDPICRQFSPEFVLVSAGFDGHLQDPMAGMSLSTESFGLMARSLLRLAADSCDGRWAAVLEGGYDLEALGASVLRVLDEMGGERLAEPIPDRQGSGELADRMWSVQRRYWSERVH
jgi:acetoin utilization deacetylase AcuC-like enzyme